MYSVHYQKENLTIFERDPCKKILIQNPDECEHNYLIIFRFRKSLKGIDWYKTFMADKGKMLDH